MQIGEDDLGAFLGKKPSLRCTQAARRARYERDFSCHSVAHPAILLLILCLLNSLSAQFRPASLRVLFSDAQQLGRSPDLDPSTIRSEEHTSELQSLMRISYAVFCLKTKKTTIYYTHK